MSDIRRVYLTGHDEEVLLYDSGGPFVIVPWEEWERLQAVVDAARELHKLRGWVEWESLADALRALDGEPCQTCHGAAFERESDRVVYYDCPTCGGSGEDRSTIHAKAYYGKFDPCPTCKGEAKLEQYNCPTCHGR